MIDNVLECVPTYWHVEPTHGGTRRSHERLRSWRSNLYLPVSVLREADRELRQEHGIDPGSTLWPACDACSKRLGLRFAVEEYGIAETGRTITGEKYTDIRARCHGHEDVVRIEGVAWDLKTDAKRDELVRIAAIGAITFFAPQDANRTIPARVFRAFIGAH